MKKSAYGKPILLSEGGVKEINKKEFKDELSIQNLVFENPLCIPVSDIDESFNPIVPICKELNTGVGPLDIFMLTPNGDIVIIETKLWRNPEARRKVVAQILDYANEISSWSYEDLQREINKKLKRKGNSLYNLVKEKANSSIIDEANFVDAVSRNLSRGKFLLLIIGDGIKEGASNIANFLSSSAHLNFTFGMVELTLYEIDEKMQVVLPKTIVKTKEIQKFNIELPEGMFLSSSFSDVETQVVKSNPLLEKRRSFFKSFWEEFIPELYLDDAGQSLPKITSHQNIFLYLNERKEVWVSAFFSQSTKSIGVYFSGRKNEEINHFLDVFLFENFDDIKSELGEELQFYPKDSGKKGFFVTMSVEDVYDRKYRKEIKSFFNRWINEFINVLRPRIDR